MNRLSFALLVITFSAIVVTGQLPKKRTGLTNTDRAKWFAALKWAEEDNLAADVDRFPNKGFTFHRLSKSKWLVEIVTGAAAYQLNYVYSVLDDGGPNWITTKPLHLQSYFHDENGHIKRETVPFAIGTSSFDKSKKTFSVYYKGSGLGYCGSLTKYQIVNNRARTVEARVRSCNSSATGRWPRPEKWSKIKLR